MPRPTDAPNNRWSPPTHKSVEATADKPRIPSYGDRQREQRGPAKRYHEKNYRKNKNKVKRRSDKWYDRKKNRGTFKRDQQLRRDRPEKFDRLPAGGYSTNKERSKDDRRKQAELFYRVVQKGLEKIDRATPYGGDDGVADPMYQNREFPMIHIERWKDRRSNWLSSLPRQLADLFTALIRSPLWKRYRDGSVGDAKVADWFSENGYPLTVPEWRALRTQAFKAVPGKVPEVKFRFASSVGSVLSNCQKAILDKASKLGVRVARVDRKNGVWLFNVTGSKGDNYRVRVKMPNKIAQIQDAEVDLSCSCPFWRWQGPEHWGTTEDYQYGPLQGTASFPIIRDPEHRNGACKHTVAALNVLIDRYSKIRSVNKVAAAYMRKYAGF
jgi:hypothetical protein